MNWSSPDFSRWIQFIAIRDSRLKDRPQPVNEITFKNTLPIGKIYPEPRKGLGWELILLIWGYWILLALQSFNWQCLTKHKPTSQGAHGICEEPLQSAILFSFCFAPRRSGRNFWTNTHEACRQSTSFYYYTELTIFDHLQHVSILVSRRAVSMISIAHNNMSK